MTDSLESLGICSKCGGPMDAAKADDFGPADNFTFGGALVLLKHGSRLQRAGWNGKGMYIELQRPDAHSEMSLPYLFMKTVQGDLVPWLASQTDILAEDWRLA